MSSLYARVKADLVIPKLKEYGVPVVLKQIESDYNPATGENSQTVSEFKGYGIRRKTASKRFEKAVIEDGSMVLMVSGIPKPSIGDSIVFDGSEYSVRDLEVAGPGAVDLYYEVAVK